jgi:molybdopterin biosynthesis enzyme
MGLPPTERMNASTSLSSLPRPDLPGAGMAGRQRSALVAFEYLVVAFIAHSQVVNPKLQGVLEAHAREPVFAQPARA